MTDLADNLRLRYPDLCEDLTSALLGVLGQEAFICPEDIAEKYHSDWTFTDLCRPAGLMLPASTDQVSQVLRLCNNANQPIVIQGGLTGLTGGATPREKELALSLERLNGVESIDKNNLSLTVQAGTTLAEIHKRLEGRGLTYGVDYGARNSCQIGGNVATNAGGTQVIRFGMTRAQVLGLEAVLADGTVIDSMNQLLKNNAGYDLKQLFIGSEGTLGVITKLVLRLFPETSTSCTGLFALNNFQNGTVLLNLCRRFFGESLQAFEIMWHDYYTAAMEVLDSVPLSHQQQNTLYALVEIKGRRAQRDAQIFQDLFQQCLEQDVLIDGAIAETEQEAEQIWQLRYAVKTLLKTKQPLANFDIGIPINQMDAFVNQTRQSLSEQFADLETLFFGHIGDGNLHLLATTGNDSDLQPIYDCVYPICSKFAGTISAEHGIGSHKKAKLPLTRTPAEIALMQTIKQALDPKGILNPGRIFDIE